MNARVGDVEVVIGNFGVPVVNWAGRRIVQFCKDAGLLAGNTWFKKKRVNKYTWLRVNGADEAFVDWVLIDKRLIDKRLKGSLKDVNVLRSLGGVIGGDHFLVVAKMCWRRTRYERKE
jgi:integral membrane sensor domain MASE1